MAKNTPAVQEPRVQALGEEYTLEKEWQPAPAFLLGEFRDREPVGHCPWSHRVRHD